MSSIVIIALAAGILAVATALYLFKRVMSSPAEDARAVEISNYIAQGARAFLARQYTTVFKVGVPVCLLLIIIPNLGWQASVGFAVGAIFSALAGFAGMNISVGANVRVAQAAKSGFAPAFGLAFQGGSVTGLLVVGGGILAMAALIMIFGTDTPGALIGVAFGGSLISVFARLGGGIFTKAADVGADLVGKVEANIPEDDPRNPAVIADNVGDNVGDCAGMAADLFETYAVTMAAVMLLAGFLFEAEALKIDMLLYPLLVGVVGIVGSIVGILAVKVEESQSDEAPNIMGAMYRGMTIAMGVALGLLFVCNFIFLPGDIVTKDGTAMGEISLLLCVALGFAVTWAMMWITDVYTGDNSRFVAQIAKDSEGGHGTNVISGLAVGMNATGVPVFVIVSALMGSFQLAGLYGVGIAAMGMLSLAGIIVAIDAYGPITDNAGGIAEMAEMGDDVRNITDPLDAVGNTTKAVTKGYAIASAGLAAVVLFATYIQDLQHAGVEAEFSLADPYVLAGLFLGAAVPFIFASLAMSSVSRAAGSVVAEVRRQFRDIPGIMEGTGKPEYGKCVDIVTQAALKEMVAPALIPALAPVVVMIALIVTGQGSHSAEVVGGLLIGSIACGICMGVSMCTGGAAWDNAKKFIESGAHGGKGSDAHKAAVTGDTVGDPYKDTAGPAINPMLKLLNIVALLIVPFLA